MAAHLFREDLLVDTNKIYQSNRSGAIEAKVIATLSFAAWRPQYLRVQPEYCNHMFFLHPGSVMSHIQETQCLSLRQLHDAWTADDAPSCIYI